MAQLKTACQPRAHAQPRGPLQGCRLSMKVVRLNDSNFILVYARAAKLKTACQPRAHAQPRGPLQGCRLSMKVVRLNGSNFILVYALVAQLDSVSASDAEGCGFDPRRVHQQKKPPVGLFLLVCPAASTHRVRPAEGGTRRSAPKYPSPAPRGAFLLVCPAASIHRVRPAENTTASLCGRSWCSAENTIYVKKRRYKYTNLIDRLLLYTYFYGTII